MVIDQYKPRTLYYITSLTLRPLFTFTLVSAIPEEWRKQLKVNEKLDFSNEHHINLNSFSLHLVNEKVDTEKKMRSKLLYETFSSNISSKQTATNKKKKKIERSI